MPAMNQNSSWFILMIRSESWLKYRRRAFLPSASRSARVGDTTGRSFTPRHRRREFGGTRWRAVGPRELGRSCVSFAVCLVYSESDPVRDRFSHRAARGRRFEFFRTVASRTPTSAVHFYTIVCLRAGRRAASPLRQIIRNRIRTIEWHQCLPNCDM